MAVFSDILGAGKFGGTPKIPAAFGRYSSQATPQGTLPKPPKSIDLRNLADNLVSRHGNCYRVTAEIGTTCLPHLSAINSLRNQACAWFAPEIRLGCSPETAGAHSRTGLPGPEREERPGPGLPAAGQRGLELVRSPMFEPFWPCRLVFCAHLRLCTKWRSRSDPTSPPRSAKSGGVEMSANR